MTPQQIVTENFCSSRKIINRMWISVVCTLDIGATNFAPRESTTF